MMEDIASSVLADFQRDGFVILRQAMVPEVVTPLLDAVGADALVVLDQAGNRQELNAWTWCGDDLVGRLPRSDSFVDLATLLVGEPVYHWHSKLSWKRPDTPGTWDWHQDYGFWIEEGCATPSMVTVSVAVDQQDQTNGCLRVLRGSHQQGVLPHPQVGKSRAVDPKTIEAMMASHEVVDVELDPGDVVAFHCNTIHGSGANTSDRTRTLLHASYNAVSNAATAPLIDGHQFNELERLADSAVEPGQYESVLGDTSFVRVEDDGYGGRNGYQVMSADAPPV